MQNTGKQDTLKWDNGRSHRHCNEGIDATEEKTRNISGDKEVGRSYE